MTLANRLERLTGAVTAIAALGAVAIMAWRELRPPPRNSSAPSAEARPLALEQVRSARALASMGEETARHVSLLIFTDVECPFCAILGRALDTLTGSGNQFVEVGIINFPLPQHKFARLGAYAVECARTQGRLRQLLSVLYTDQSSIGLRPWSEFAARAGVIDTAEFTRCLESTRPKAAIDRGLELGKQLGLLGTPSVLVDNYLLGQPPQAHQLRALFDSLRAGANLVTALRGAGYVVSKQ